MWKVDRRTVLRSLGAMAMSPLLVRCGGKPRPLVESIDTVVHLMLENRSFDHYFGTWSLDEGKNVDGLVAGMSNQTSTGEVITAYPETARCILDLPHSWRRSHNQFAEGANSGFVREAEEDNGIELAGETMGYLRRDQIPIIHQIADQHALCERWFSSIMGGTWPNRFYSLAGQSDGVKTNEPDYDYGFATIYDRMQTARRTWKVYYSNVSFSQLFSRDYDRANFLPIERFFEDAAAGTLPNLAIVEPIYGLNDDHPPGHPLAGQILMASIYDALAKSPSWRRSTFIITYDEHGGFYDHVPPPKVEDERAAEGFDQLGFRVPTVVAGPWIKSGHVSRTTYDHTSFLAFLQTLYGLKPLTARDASANDMTDLLDLDRIEADEPQAPAELPVIEADEAVIYAEECRHELFGPKLVTGQPELELFLDAHPARAWADRRSESEQIHDRLLAHAERRGLLRWR
jgi:phospholipase C